jgi:autotransporter-associated beta strand protein
MKLSGVISGAGSLVYSGAGVLTLSGTNTYTGTTTVSAGKLSVATIGDGGVTSGNLGSATNAAANLVFDGGTLQYTGVTASTDRNFTINTGKTATFDITTNNLTVSGASTATNGALTKTGAGTLTLTSTNTYTGTTTVSAGKLVMGDAPGDTFATSAVNVAATATLGGSGTLNGSVTLAAETFSGAKNGGTLAPGNSPGTSIVGGSTTFNQGSIFSWDISADGGSFDKLQTATLVNGGSAGGSVFQIVVADADFGNTFWDTAQSWSTIITTDGSTAITDWANIFSSTVSVVNSSFTPITPVDGSFSLSGSTLTWSAVPEPSSGLVGLLIGAGLLRRRRRA